MEESKKLQFEEKSKQYLSGVSLNNLRAYGRELGVSKPTKKGKDELIALIVSVLVGDLQAQAISRRGAPVKNDHVDPKVVERMEMLKREYLGEQATGKSSVSEEIQAFRRENPYAHLQLYDPVTERIDRDWVPVQGIFRGQVQVREDSVVTLPLGSVRGVASAFLLQDTLERYRLLDGDVISYRAREKNGVRVITEILSINERVVIAGERMERTAFEEQIACYPEKPLNFFEIGKSESVEAKYAQWVLGLCKGQRACVVSSPKAGKSTFLYNTATALLNAEESVYVLALLVGATPELVGSYRKCIESENLTYTTYENDPEEQVQTAELALARAKRLAESGFDVVFVVDGLTSLARAYNETDASAGGKVLAGGLESKTLQYIKRYFGLARALENGGSLTMLCGVSENTGDPADEWIVAGVKELANACVQLDDTLALARIYPAVDLGKSFVQSVNGENERIRAYVQQYGNEELIRLLKNCQNEVAFAQTIEQKKR